MAKTDDGDKAPKDDGKHSVQDDKKTGKEPKDIDPKEYGKK
ncbi:hypothetical protein [Haloechinothrix aidingensis]|nr:hypothetical protein [Haloechinothrix aidingensis]